MKSGKLRTGLIITTILSLVFTLLQPTPAAAAQQTEKLGELRLKWFDFLTGGTDIDLQDEDIKRAAQANAAKVTNESGTGAWDTMNKQEGRSSLWADYNSTTNSSHITNSYNRLKDMAIAFATPGTKLHKDTGLRDDILAGIDWMYQNRYNVTRASYNNWWDWEIGAPLALADIVTLMYDDLSEEQITAYTSTIDRFVPNPDKRLIGAPGLTETGANLMDKALAVVLRGILGSNEAKIAQSRDALDSVFPYVSGGDGFYKDGSFIQHNNIAYTGSYGSVLLGNMGKLLTLLADSDWPVDSPGFENVWNWVTDSFEPVIYNGHIMEMVSGRAVSRYNNNTRGAVWTILRLSQFAPEEEAQRYKEMVKEWLLADQSVANPYEGVPIRDIVALKKLLNDDSIERRGGLARNYALTAMDRIVHSREAFTFGISMSSTRIANYEGSTNGEHTKGWYTGDGMTYLYNQDAGYYRDGFWPTIDPLRLAGVTSDGKQRTATRTTSSTWVGGSSLDKAYGAAGMDLSPPGSDLRGKKSWFMFDDEIVALGADLTTGTPRTDGKQVETIVENRMIASADENALTVDGEMMPAQSDWSEKLSQVKWAHIAGTLPGADVGYYFPGGSDVSALRETRSEAWSSINPSGPATPLTRNYLSLAVEHGAKATAAEYAYVLLPGKNTGDTNMYSENPDIRILSNTAAIQAVQETKLGVTGINFWRAGETEQVRAYQPASVMVKEAGDEWTVVVSDPTQAQAKVRVELAAVALEQLEADSTVTVLRSSPSVLLEVATAGTKGASHTIKLKVDPDADTGLPVEEGVSPDPEAVIRVDVTADAYVNGGANAAVNYGNTGYLNIRNGTGLYDRRTYLKYDLSTLSSEVERAYLYVYGRVNDSAGGTANIGAYAVEDDSWAETGLNYNNRPAEGARMDDVTFNATNEWRSFDVTSFINQELLSNETATVMLRQFNGDKSSEIRSRENEGGTYRSYLELLMKDETAPATTVRFEADAASAGLDGQPVTLLVEAQDNEGGWGVWRTQYRINGGGWMTVESGRIVLLGDGSYKVEYRSTDKAGNVEQTKQLAVTIFTPTAELVGPEQAIAGESIEMMYRINTGLNHLYASEFVVDYDSEMLIFDSAEAAQGHIIVAGLANEPGRLGVIVAGLGQPLVGNENLVKLVFKAASVEETATTRLKIVEAQAADRTGKELTLRPTSIAVTVKAQTEEPGTGEPGTGEPGTGGPGTSEPGTSEPGTGEPGTSEPGTDEPGTEEPGTDEPGTDEPREWSDVQGHWSESVIKEAAKLNWLNGYPDGTFRPDKAMTRAEFAALVVRALGLSGANTLTFADTEQMPEWARDAIAIGVRNGFIAGYEDNTFRANRPITRLEMAVMIARVLELTRSKQTEHVFADAGDIPAWGRDSVAAVFENGLFQGKGGNRFAPNAGATRAEAVTVLLRALNRE
ncbi:polysaccharide lyase family 8 super-sandwich domain-containing protein [Paenibacillus agaridevorans]|uniref:polysaccharide lyase family 8 super-sandwich domain-containing protein n=1 Tax=Paenibacillus agaridevorans TaxID=171404 RepID=UPI001FEB23AB|nr:polysaccharide lyase family 8 super-sandwich domain-containing protein [Paenibacillus agaridevorans]